MQEQIVLAGHLQEGPTVGVECASPEVVSVQRMMEEERMRRPEFVGWRNLAGKEDLDLNSVLQSVDEQEHEEISEMTDLMMGCM